MSQVFLKSFLIFLAVLHRRDMGDLFENAAEMMDVLESGALADRHDFIIGLTQQALGFPDAQQIDIVRKGIAGILLKQTAQVILADRELLRDLFQTLRTDCGNSC